MAINPVTNKIYVPADSGVLVIDGVTDSIIATVPAGTSPFQLAVNSVTNKIYVENNDMTVTTLP